MIRISFQKLNSWNSFAHDPLLQEVLAEPSEVGQAALVERMRQVFIRFSELRYGYQEYSEVTVVNPQGEYIAQTGEVEVDIGRMDSTRMRLVQDRGVAMGVFTYDDGAGVWGIPLSVRITNDSGEFIGVVTGVVSAGVLVRQEELQGKRYDTTNVLLLTAEGEKIYETGAFRFLEDVAHEDFFSQIGEESGFFVTMQGGREKLFAYAHSAGFRSYEGLDWVLFITHDTDEVFESVRTLRNLLIGSFGVLLLVIWGVGVYSFPLYFSSD